jgi:hypothetical protein
MSGPLIILTGLIYLWIGIEQAMKGNAGMAITYVCYAGANAGLWLLATKN